MRKLNMHVVMGNDFPAAVFSSKVKAERYCVRMREKNKRDDERNGQPFGPRIYWRVYTFEVDAFIEEHT